MKFSLSPTVLGLSDGTIDVKGLTSLGIAESAGFHKPDRQVPTGFSYDMKNSSQLNIERAYMLRANCGNRHSLRVVTALVCTDRCSCDSWSIRSSPGIKTKRLKDVFVNPVFFEDLRDEGRSLEFKRQPERLKIQLNFSNSYKLSQLALLAEATAVIYACHEASHVTHQERHTYTLPGWTLMGPQVESSSVLVTIVSVPPGAELKQSLVVSDIPALRSMAETVLTASRDGSSAVAAVAVQWQRPPPCQLPFCPALLVPSGGSLFFAISPPPPLRQHPRASPEKIMSLVRLVPPPAC
ncbi:hypothetical protein CRG98_014865 [Punica granatum]|uniref:Uncharacterized protein n=1 Tax=Punica granatum TaxID=22663 RepID=A0A2I0K9G6_PUNGR|nr:hypothetical protein CRG98_014865 [Punica granatum]